MERAVAAFDQFVDSPDAKASAARRILGDFTLTAYAVSEQSTGKTPRSPDFGITFSGTRARVSRTVAVDPKVIPIGTLIYIDGIGWRLAEDTGGAVKGHHIDVLMTSDAKALQFGVKRHVHVYTVTGVPSR